MTAGKSTMEAGWFSTPIGPLFGCYHPPSFGRSRAVGVLMCDPFGSDRMNLHLSYRALAEKLAEAGFPTLRFDYPGTCDSSGQPATAARVSIWQDSIATAADFLLARAGCTELTLFGALLGGTLAWNVAGNRSDVSGLVLWGALPSGRQFLREVRAFSAMTTANPHGHRPSRWRTGDHEAIGFLVPQEMVTELESLQMPDLSGSSLRAAAVFRRNAAVSVEPITDALGAAGVEVTVQERAALDMAELVAEKALPPENLLDEMVNWWDRTFPRSLGAADSDGQAPNPLRPRIEMPGPTGEDVEEQVVRFGADEAIFGIVTRHPSPAQRLGVAIVLVNGGSNHRVGINRNYTDWARRWASSGYTVLRFDIRGLGDSPPQRSKDLGVLYREETRQDVIAAIDFLTHSQQVDRFVCLGLCAGGYQSFHAALEDPRVTGVIMLNPLRFRPVDPAGHADIDLKHAPAAHYARVWRDRARWRRLLHGQVDVLGIVGSMVRRWARSAWARLRSLCGAAPQGTTWLAARLLRLTGRGCRVCIVFDSSDPMCERTQQELINDRAHLEATGKFFFETIDGTDHIFSPLWSQERLTERLDAIMQTWSLTTNVSDGRPRETSDHGHKDGNFLPHG